APGSWPVSQTGPRAPPGRSVPPSHPGGSGTGARPYGGGGARPRPLVEPLYEGKSSHELIDALFGTEGEQTSHDIVRATYTKGRDAAELERFWRQTLHDGVVQGSALPPRPRSLKSDWISALPPAAARDPHVLEIAFRPDPPIFDGRSINNGWLQELPKPVSKLTWDNVAMFSPATASRLALENEGTVVLSLGGRSVEAPVWIQPGQADDCVTVHLGYGRSRTGRVGSGAGFDAYQIRASSGVWAASGVEVRKTGRTRPLACTQLQQTLEGRNMVRSTAIDEFRRDPEFAQKLGEAPAVDDTMYASPVVYDGYAWGMTVD